MTYEARSWFSRKESRSTKAVSQKTLLDLGLGQRAGSVVKYGHAPTVFLLSLLDLFEQTSVEVIDELQAIGFESKLRVPQPSKSLEGIRSLLRRVRQQLDTVPAKDVTVSQSFPRAEKLAAIEAERQKAQGLAYSFRAVIR